jgi:6-phospho-beta-glucosidase
MYFLSVLLPIVSASPNPLPIAWGFATSAYQIEGAWNVDGKGPSVWDHWYNDPSRAGRPNANVANDHYHRMVEDIAYLGQLGATAYRFSVAWPRIFPDCTGTPNPAGLKFYSDMIDELLKHGVEPVLTLFHWETPQACHDRYESWLSPQIVQDFTSYADVVFENYGSRIKHILTINEPHAFCGFGFQQAFWPPGANAGTGALYRCLHHVNLVHGSVHKLAARKYPQYGLKFGMPLIISHGVPFDPSSAADIQAAREFNAHQTDMHYGVFLSGDYPPYLRALDNQWVKGQQLLTFTAEEQVMMRGSMDFLAINYYSANYVSTTERNLPAIGPSGGN